MTFRFSFPRVPAHLVALTRGFLIAALAFMPLAMDAAPAKSKKVITSPTPPPSYKGAIVVNADSGEVLFEDHADVINPPASVTKLMTFLVVHDAIQAGQIHLDTPVTVTAEDSKVGGTQVWLKQGETFTVEELLYALMIQSANDCASALSHAAATSREEFVERMNARAQSLGMTNTTFRTPHGLPPANRRTVEGDLTTPRDLAKLSRELITHTDVLRYSSVRRRPFGASQRAQPVDMVNHNKLLGKVDGVDGLKTGFTNGAGFCLAATATRNGNRLIVVTMGSPDANSRNLDITRLFERYFSQLPAKPASPVSASSPIATTPPPAAAPAPAPAPAQQTPNFAISPVSPAPTATGTAAPAASGTDSLPQVKFVPIK